ncbi:MAG: nicotinate-nucleotide adenylyltransferase [Vicinamibacterales bacterium]
MPAPRIGILGGTLDPIHVGHIEAAVAVRDSLPLTGVVIMPARVPPHRQQGPSASTFHRFAMAALAVNELADFTVSDDEFSVDGPSYTALTLERLAARGLQPSQIFFITGADAFAEIETWYRYPAVLDLAHFAVVSRAGSPAAAIADRLPQLRERLAVADRSGRIPAGPSIFLVEASTPDVSSTEVRRRLRTGDSITGLVPGPVERYIHRHRLYAETRTADHLR